MHQIDFRRYVAAFVITQDIPAGGDEDSQVKIEAAPKNGIAQRPRRAADSGGPENFASSGRGRGQDDFSRRTVPR